MTEDIYPSRGGRKAELVQRKDPVVYNKYDGNCPVSRDHFEDYKRDGFMVLLTK